MTLIITPYKVGSRSARALKNALSDMGNRVYVLRRKPKNTLNPVLNWGNSELPFATRGEVINPPEEVAKLTNKLRFFRFFDKEGAMVVPWTDKPEEAQQWDKVMCRTKLEGSGGDGIIVWKQGDGPLPKAALYTQYTGKTAEYRIHMARKVGDAEFKPILIQRKVFKKTPERPAPAQWEIRNHARGFYFVADNEHADPVPQKVLDLSKKVMETTFPGMHLCALDVIYNNKTKKAHVLEGNTAVGMEGNTVNIYAKHIHDMLREAGL